MVPEFLDVFSDAEDDVFLDAEDEVLVGAEEGGFGADEGWLDEDFGGDSDGLGWVLQDALSDGYADAGAVAFDDALAEVFDSMSAAEAFSFAKALRQIERTAGKVVSDPVFRQVAGTALPIATGALGTLVGGPVGTAVGSSLGRAAAGALTGAGRGRAGGAGIAGAIPGLAGVVPGLAGAIPGLAGVVPGLARAVPVAGGSAAAAQGLVLTQQPDVLKSLLALSLGQHGKAVVNGVPVAKVMNMLSSVFGQAAADADELMYLGETEGFADGEAFGYPGDAGPPVSGRELYTLLLDADNAELAEALEAL